MKTIVLFALLLTGFAQAEIYKWKDAGGKMHYSDQPPNGGKAKVLQTKDLPVSSVSPQRREASTAASTVAGKAPASVPAAIAPVVKSDKDEKACKEALARLGYLKGSQKFSSVNEKGKLEFMESAQRKAETASVEANIKRVCP